MITTQTTFVRTFFAILIFLISRSLQTLIKANFLRLSDSDDSVANGRRQGHALARATFAPCLEGQTMADCFETVEQLEHKRTGTLHLQPCQLPVSMTVVSLTQELFHQRVEKGTFDFRC
ncbi:hypothetical protein BaRGS_00023785 [Batillaria attramentaria]|uniref:Secreted protein n=1 Tax=Batillaria attramentaria TaxID=370345 RepID=A0ABD0KD91_9CAEN